MDAMPCRTELPVVLRRFCMNRKSMDLERFDVVKSLGKGEYGSVVLVYDRAADANFAVKIIPTGSAEIDSGLIEELTFEKLTMDKLAGRHCFAQCYFTALTRTHAWFCLKYYPGGTLTDLLKKCFTTEAKLTFLDAQYILAELVCAIREMHSHGVLHRDIKKDNVMIDEEGHIVVIDFGLSVVLNTNKPLHEQVCREKFALGCAHIAPEMTTAPASYSYPADLHALGVLMGRICSKNGLDRSSWSSDRRGDAADLEAALIEAEPCKRATITDVTNHRFFQGIRWEDAQARKLDMNIFRPTDTVRQKPEQDFGALLGSRTILRFVDHRLRDFCSFDRYRNEIQNE